MGLDMYAYTAPRQTVTEPVNFKLPDEAVQIHRWRKHPNLHGWMEELYQSKGGTETFNCEPVELTLDDLANLEEAIQNGNLPLTGGFFFGASDGSETDDDIAFIAKAREAISQGLAVIYDSWW